MAAPLASSTRGAGSGGGGQETRSRVWAGPNLEILRGKNFSPGKTGLCRSRPSSSNHDPGKNCVCLLGG